MKTEQQISFPDGNYINQNDQRCSLKSYIIDKYLVVFFYPKDMTSGCTLEVQNFRDALTELTGLGAAVIGVSRDSVRRHQKFIEAQQLNFDLISDADSELCEHFNVLKEKSMFGKKYMGIERSTFIFDCAGNCVASWRKVKVPGHVNNVLETLRALK